MSEVNSKQIDIDITEPRSTWSFAEMEALYNLPLPRLIWLAQGVQQKNFNDEVQLCSLLSIKTGGCKEDCAYCPQSAHHSADIKAEPLLDVDSILTAAKAAKKGGSTRFCMGAAWRSPPTRGRQFQTVLEAIRQVNGLGLEVCTTLGMLDEEQAYQLKKAGVYAYNHNIDTSPEFYDKIVTTRQFKDRLETLRNVRKAGMTVCCGGIVGMGEGKADRIAMVLELAKLDPHPESVPINLLVQVEGTPISDRDHQFDVFEMVRTIALARIAMPRSRVRLSAGREDMSDETQALCFIAGANSIFTGDKLLTTKNPGEEKDLALLSRLGLKPGQEAQPPLS